MFKKLLNKKLLKNQKGLTLIELLAVIVILAIIAAIAIPAIGNIIENSRYNAVKADAINVLNAANIYFTDNPEVPGPIEVKAHLIENKYLETAGKIPNNATIERGTTGPNGLTTAAITFSGSGSNAKQVTFVKATIISINADITKGSKINGNKNIDHTVPTP